MKIQTLLALASLCLTSCVTSPEPRQILDPVPRVIRLPADQKIPFYNKDPRVYHLFAAGDYRLIKEDADAYYYANEREEFRYKYLKPEAVWKGGIGYWKKTGYFFIYFATSEAEARSNVASMAGALPAAFVKSSTGDKTVRTPMTMVLPECESDWQFINE